MDASKTQTMTPAENAARDQFLQATRLLKDELKAAGWSDSEIDLELKVGVEAA